MEPPAVNGTTNRTGLDGHTSLVWACALHRMAEANNATASLKEIPHFDIRFTAVSLRTVLGGTIGHRALLPDGFPPVQV